MNKVIFAAIMALFLCTFLVLMLAPVFAQTSFLIGTSTENMESLLAKLKKNVAGITENEERERWSANLNLWSIDIFQDAIPDRATATGPLQMMESNIGRISNPAEKERWQANIDLWNAATSGQKDLTPFKETLNKMKANIDAIGEPKEKERWQINYQLWESTLSN